MKKTNKLILLFLVFLAFFLLHNSVMIGLSNVFTLFREDNKSDLKVSSYKEKIEVLEKEISEYESSLESLKIYDGSSYVLAKIALRDGYNFYDTLVVSTDSLVKKGSAVINEDGLVGVVRDANKKTAKVDMITKPLKVSVQIGEYYGVMDYYNEKDGLFVVHNINNYANVEVGSEVTTSGLSKIDGGIKIGTVSKIEKSSVETLVYVKPYVDFNHLNYLMVVNK